MATLKLEIVTPEGRAYSDDVAMVVLPAIEGEIGVYPAHVPLMTQLRQVSCGFSKTARRPNWWLAQGLLKLPAIAFLC